MIFREVDGRLYNVTDVLPDQEDRFMEKNPTGGFIKVDSEIPYSRYGNLKLVDGEVVVDEEKETEQAQRQYRLDRVYPDLKEQLDALYRDIVNGTVSERGEFFTMIKSVKDSVPKPIDS
jgi:hypothetical protein